MNRLKSWVKNGGTLVAIGDATLFVAKSLQLAAVKSWADPADSPAAKNQLPMQTPGAFLRVRFQNHHWLGAGYGGELPALVYSSRILLSPEGRVNRNRRIAAVFADAENLRMSSHIWPEVQKRMAGAVFAYEEKHGRGRVILLAEDPNFRGYWRAADRLFLNAVILAIGAP